MRLFGGKRRLQKIHEIDPDEVFLDSSNLPGHQASQFEGRVERPVSTRSIIMVGAVFILLAVSFSVRAYILQITHGADYADISKNNTLRHTLIFATRGVIYDRTGRELAWNTPQTGGATSSSKKKSPPQDERLLFEIPRYALRAYTPMPGLSHLIGFLQYPKEDAAGNWWRDTYTGISGVESDFDKVLSGTNGQSIEERDAHGTVIRHNIVSPPTNGRDLHLSIDADLQSKLYTLLHAHAQDHGFKGGAAIIIDVRTGELLAITSFPEYDHAAFTDGDAAIVSEQSKSSSKLLLNRALSGLYAPGSIVKPIFAAAALNEKIISPDKQINSIGAITIPNPYDKAHPSVFRDWRVHGWIDMRTALAVSSDEYFYTIGGGFGGQQGLGITHIDSYARRFGLGTTTGITLSGEKAGVIPTPAWQVEAFGADDPWRIGDTYHTAIGQYGFQITPIQAVRFVAAIASGGTLWTPQIIASTTALSTSVNIPDQYLQIVREGMRMAVTSDRPDATVKALYIGGIAIAAKTGTAQIGAHNEWMNSWSVGFWPVDNPHYAYAVVLERAPAGTPSGAAPAMQPFFRWLIENHPEYLH